MIGSLEQKFWRFISSFSPVLRDALWKRQRVIKYVISGGTAAVVNVALLYFFTESLGFWYVISSILSFIAGIIVSFYFQKFWTFEDNSTDEIHKQALFYLTVAMFNLGVNTILIFMFVETFGTNYILAQIMAGLIIACENFIIYKKIIFRKRFAKKD